MTKNNNTAKQCLALCPLFEAELLLELMLRNWDHPYATDETFRQNLLESTTEVLMTASDESCTEVFIEGLPTREMNFVAAIWYTEWLAVQANSLVQERRREWLNNVRHSLPSCFCPSDMLGS